MVIYSIVILRKKLYKHDSKFNKDMEGVEPTVLNKVFDFYINIYIVIQFSI